MNILVLQLLLYICGRDFLWFISLCVFKNKCLICVDINSEMKSPPSDFDIPPTPSRLGAVQRSNEICELLNEEEYIDEGSLSTLTGLFKCLESFFRDCAFFLHKSFLFISRSFKCLLCKMYCAIPVFFRMYDIWSVSKSIHFRS